MTKGKSGLDKALKLSKRLHKEVSNVDEFLVSVSTELDKRDRGSPNKSLDTELTYVQVRNAELTLWVNTNTAIEQLLM